MTHAPIKTKAITTLILILLLAAILPTNTLAENASNECSIDLPSEDDADDLTGAQGDCDPCEWPELRDLCAELDPTSAPWVKVYPSFSYSNCKGQRERVIDYEVTVTAGGGLAVSPKIAAIFGFATATVTAKDKGWRWSFDCDLTINYLYAEGGGGIYREVIILGTSTQDTPTEANCLYYFDGGCTTPSILEGTWTVTVSSDGITEGYPKQHSVELSARGENRPLGGGTHCLTHHLCVNTPGPGSVIEPSSAKHSPAESTSTEIEWTEIDLGIQVPPARTLVQTPKP